MRVVKLAAAGLDDAQKIVDAPFETLRKLATRPVAERLQQRAAAILERRKQEAAEAAASEKAGSPATAVAADEPKRWPRRFHRADPAGASYLCDATVVLDGRAQKRRHLASVNGREVWLRERSFEAMVKFAVAAKTSDLGWLSCAQIGSPAWMSMR